MTSAQFESVNVEILADGTPVLQAEAVSVEVLATGSPVAQVETVYVEVLAGLVTPSNLFDFAGVQREVYQWDGSTLKPASLAV